ncbi:hypothetical protein BJY18_002554 [Amycolatopsis jiangsuensis]|uniref:Uncharacterized protein n=1 Tax=Amycolatopsis jiangsuensis TaxID=1181879 RepID=A0A840IU65_9PSEU|nr:hypothetical protein [Amycolatopsis jiangsuensis]
MTPIFELSADHVTAEAALDPVTATVSGVDTDPAALTDYSPSGFAARADLARATLARLARLTPESAGDRIAGAHLRERLEAQLTWHDLGEPLRTVKAHFGTLGQIRDSVDLLPRRDAEDWRVVAVRLAGAEPILAGWPGNCAPLPTPRIARTRSWPASSARTTRRGPRKPMASAPNATRPAPG